MSDNTESDDWVEGGELTAEASNLTYFGGMSLPIDTSGLPEPSEDDTVA